MLYIGRQPLEFWGFTSHLRDGGNCYEGLDFIIYDMVSDSECVGANHGVGKYPQRMRPN